MSAHELEVSLGRRLRDRGFDVREDDLPSGRALIGYRSEFRVQWLLTKLNLFVAAIEVPVVTLERVQRHVDETLTYGIEQKGRFRGLQNGVVAIPLLVSAAVDDSAAQFATRQLVRKFSASAWPAIIDTSNDRTYSHEGAVFI